jgi:hypothetical protein
MSACVFKIGDRVIHKEYDVPLVATICNVYDDGGFRVERNPLSSDYFSKYYATEYRLATADEIEAHARLVRTETFDKLLEVVGKSEIIDMMEKLLSRLRREK